MDYEEILDLVGGDGRYQIVMYILIGISVIPAGMHALGNVFLTGLSEYYCAPPTSTQTNLSNTGADVIGIIQSWTNDENSIGQCEIYDINYSNWTAVTSLNQTREINRPDTRSCQHWRYNTSVYGKTIVSEWDLVCGKSYQKPLAQSLYMCGVLLGAVIFGSLSDSIGRKKSWGLSNLVLLVFGSASAFAPEYWSHVILRCISGMAAAGTFTCGFVLGAENICKSRRLAPAVLYQVWFCLGYGFVDVVVAYLARDYVVFQLTISLLVIISLALYWFVDESPRWLLTQGKNKQATKILQKIAVWNKKKISSDVISKSIDNINQSTESDVTQRYSVFDLLKTSNLRKKTLNLWFNWFVISMVYYGLSMGSSALAGSPYVNVCISGFMEIPGLILAYIVAQKYGRRVAMFVFMVGAGVACIFILAIPSSQWLIQSILSNLGKMGISGAFGIVYVFSAEISPTVVRTVGVGSGSMSARIGSLLAPFIGDLGVLLWKPLPILIFGSASLIAGVVSLFLPETLNQTLPDTIIEGEAFGKDHTVFSCCKKQNKLSVEDEEHSSPLNGYASNNHKEAKNNVV